IFWGKDPEDGKEKFLKRFLPGGLPKVYFFPLPAKSGSKEGSLVIAEGYATAASIHEATGCACLCAFSAGNLLNVAKMAREKCPGRSITICADYDLPNPQYPKPGGIGLALATEAARAIGAALAVPRREGHDKLDFNDLACLMGLDEVAGQVMNAPKPGPSPEAGRTLHVMTIGELL
ncbi:MAG: toprim domain-containing protein, partial [Desulfovibrionaceae bacterium]|nr:toprim domain-containing protein [Desulfovibrionaceae bacterium]